MRICFIHHPNDSYIKDRIRYLDDKGHDVISISFGRNKSLNMPESVKIISISSNFIGYNILRRFMHIKLIKNITKIYNVDILHIVNVFNGIYAKFSLSKKSVIENIGSDVIKTPIQYPIVKYFYKYFYSFADAIIQDSKLAQKYGINCGASESNNKVIEYGVDFNRFNSHIDKGLGRQALNITDNQKMIFSSRGGYQKGASWKETNSIYNLDIIIRSIPIVKKYFPDVCFVFSNSGDRSFSKDAANQLRDLGVQNNVKFTGRLDHKSEIPLYTRDADLVLSVPSTDSSPLSVYEAMACKIPVIVSDLPWYKDKFKKDHDLVVVPVKNVEKLADAIIKILNGEKSIDVDSAYEKIFNNINYEKENMKLERLYEKILAFA